MAHKTLVGGTAYNITGGKSLVSGTAYNIPSGRTLVGGTKYDITFGPQKTAMLYDDGAFVFQDGEDVENGKTLLASYTGFEDRVAEPLWNGKQNLFISLQFHTKITPSSVFKWFNNAINMVANINNFIYLDLKHVTNMFST